MGESPLNAALRAFETVEANLGKAERTLEALLAVVPGGIEFTDNPEYEQKAFALARIVEHLPQIDGWKRDVATFELQAISRMRLDAAELWEPEISIIIENQIGAPSPELREYRMRYDQKRRELLREHLSELIEQVDKVLPEIAAAVSDAGGPRFGELEAAVAEIGMLLGSSIPHPARCADLNRHIRFGESHDIHDIVQHDWPNVRRGLLGSMYGDTEAVPVAVADLGALVRAAPMGPVATTPNWSVLTDGRFERLLYVLISTAEGYENPEWLMHTHAADRGRDLSVCRVFDDPLGGTLRLSTIIQCKHCQTKSVNVADLATIRERVRLWGPPRIDACVIATTGRFTADAVFAIEKHNGSDSGLRIEM